MTTSRIPLVSTEGYAVGNLGRNVGQPCRYRYKPGLFHCYVVPGLPRTNNDLEHEFGSQRYHERRASGRKTASPGTVARGEARLPAAIATRLRRPSGPDLGRADRMQWKSLRHRLDRRRYSSVMRRRFRQNPAAYLADLEQKACQQTLPP